MENTSTSVGMNWQSKLTNMHSLCFHFCLETSFPMRVIFNVDCICFLAVVRNIHCLFYMGPVGHSKSNLETRIPYFCLKGAKYF